MGRYKLDPYAKGEKVLSINNLQFSYPTGYYSEYEHEKSLNGKTECQGGILPDDNVRIFVPLGLNANAIMHRLQNIYACLDYPSNDNEIAYGLAVDNIISQLDI